MIEEKTFLEKKSFLNFTVFDYNKKYQNIELIILSLASFVIPLFFGHPQLLIGTIVNALLFKSALTSSFKKTLPIILLPSIGALVGGVLFGGFTPFLLYFIPIIWISNALYVLTAKFTSQKMKQNYGGNVLIASLLKSGLLFASAIIMVTFFGVPSVFLTVMGLLQLYTALLGGTAALVYLKIEQSIKVKK
jgi:hypothetical protein